MGQRQSTDNGASEQDAPLKQDYYELLGVERTATEEEIKKAYRRKALELHPDRNYGNEDGATRLFAEVQAAYEILSDPQERAWYDSHRDVLLRGDGSGVEGEEYSYNMRITTSEDVLKFMMKFNKNVEYSDSPSGFYGALNDFFLQLAKEEDIACQWQDIEYCEYPEFGTKDDEYEDIVRPFYGAWTGFATKKSYSWKDQYRLQDAPDRRIRRLMEKENQKIRDEAIQDFNDAVRTLIAFVRKRDPRVQNNQVSEVERRKALREAAAAQAARARSQRLEELKKYENEVIPEWAQSREKDPHEGGFSSESEQEQHEYDCVVCDKTFKSEAQFHAHEKSKKHTKLLKELKRDMQREGKELDLASNPAELNNLTETASHEVPISNQQGSAPSDDMENKQNLSGHEPNNETSTKKKQQQTGKPQTPASESDEEEIDDDYAPRSKVLDRLADNDTNTDDLSDRTKSLLLDEDTPATSEPDSLQQPKVGKAKQKKAKRAAKQAAAEDAPQALKCVVCGEDFASKNKLFLHIESEGHAAPPIQTKAGTKNKKTKKR